MRWSASCWSYCWNSL